VAEGVSEQGAGHGGEGRAESTHHDDTPATPTSFG
jgi:hypothetical protein